MKREAKNTWLYFTRYEIRDTRYGMFRCAFTIRSDTRYLGLLREWIFASASIAGRRSFPRQARIACTLALIEAVDNAIFHAHARKRCMPIEVSLALSSGKVVVEVIDQGSGIGRHARNMPGAMENHGRGLFLIHRLMTTVESRMKNGRHSLRMTYRISRPET